jgi:hypothetical protein
VSDQLQRTNPLEVEALFPNGSAPQPRFSRASALCSIGNTPLIITGALRQLLLQHFADSENLISATLREYLTTEGVWQENGNSLLIEAITRFDVSHLGTRPALIIKDNAWQWQRVGIGNLAAVDAITGTHYYAGLWTGSHTVFVISQQAAETQQIAVEVMRLLLYYGAQIQEDFNLQRFQVTEVGALSALKESREHYVVPISVQYVASEGWFIEQEAPRLKRIVFKASEMLKTVF